MFKNFEDLNDLQGRLVESSTAASVRGALGVQGDLLSVVHNAVNEYVDVYNKVRATRINPDTRTPEDVTELNFNSAPNNVLAQVRAQLTEKAQLLNIYVENIRDEFEATEVTGEVTLSSSDWTVESMADAFISVFGTYVPIQSTLAGWRSVLPSAAKPVGMNSPAGSGVKSFFAVQGSKIVVSPSYVTEASYAEFVAGTVHVLWGVSLQYSFIGAWDSSTGDGFTVFDGSVNDVAGIASNIDLLKKMFLDPGVTYTEQNSYQGVTKTLAPACSSPSSVSGSFSVMLNPGAVIEAMFVSQSAISDAIDALTGTGN